MQIIVAKVNVPEPSAFTKFLTITSDESILITFVSFQMENGLQNVVDILFYNYVVLLEVLKQLLFREL